MAKIIHFKRYNLAEAAFTGMVEELAGIVAATGDQCVVEVRVTPIHGGKQKKASARETLKQLIRMNDVAEWEQGAYRFCFDKNDYHWNGTAIYLTAGEALFLYRWLVEGFYIREQQHFLRNLRSRFGTSFLAEVPHG